MRVCFAVDGDRGLESRVSDHFGRAPCYIVLDTRTMAVERVIEREGGADHGRCRPVDLVAGLSVDGIVAGGIGRGAIARLSGLGVKVMRAVPGTVQHNVEQIGREALQEFDPAGGCAGRDAGHHEPFGCGRGRG